MTLLPTSRRPLNVVTTSRLVSHGLTRAKYSIFGAINSYSDDHVTCGSDEEEGKYGEVMVGFVLVGNQNIESLLISNV